MTVAAYTQFSSDLQPQKIRSGRTGRITIKNKGNFQETIKINWRDVADELNFKPKQAQLNVPEGQESVAEFQAVPRQIRWIGGEKIHPFTAQVIPSRGEPQTLPGEVISRAPIPLWVLPLLILLCVVCVGAAAVTYPLLIPKPAPTLTPISTGTLTPSPEPGAPVFEIWCIYPMNQPPGQLKGCPTQVIVQKGQKVTIQWQVSEADNVQLSPFGNRPNQGQEDYLPVDTTSFTLKASNQGKTREETIQVIVEAPSETPTNIPTPSVDSGATDQAANATAAAVGQITQAAETQIAANKTAIAQAANDTATAIAQATQIAAEETAKAKMSVTGISVSVQPQSYSGTCPTKFVFTAKITTNNSGNVAYRWERSDGAHGPTKTIPFASAGSQDVTNEWTLGKSGSYWEKVHILEPGDQFSDPANFDLNCIAPPDVDLTKGLMAYYPFNGNANDGSNNGNHGVVNGPVLTVDRNGIPDNAYNFNGQNSSINIPNSSSLQVSNQITLIAWFRPTEQKTQMIVRKGQSARSAPYTLALSGTGDIIFQLTVNSQSVDVRTHGYSLNNWIFIVGIYDGTTASLYVNGELKASQPVSGLISEDDSPLLIGTRLNLPADTFMGDIDEVRIYNRSLSADEVNAAYKK